MKNFSPPSFMVSPGNKIATVIVTGLTPRPAIIGVALKEALVMKQNPVFVGMFSDLVAAVRTRMILTEIAEYMANEQISYDSVLFETWQFLESKADEQLETVFMRMIAAGFAGGSAGVPEET